MVLSNPSPTPPAPPDPAAPTPLHRAGRRVVDAPTRMWHGLFALSFAGAWLTAESEPWRGLHLTLGYAFGGLLLWRLAYGVLGPRQARLAALWRRVSGLGDWLRQARGGPLDLSRAATLGMGAAMLLLLATAAPLVVSGYAGEVDALGAQDALEELHESLANLAMALVVAHLGLLALLSVLRRRNLAAPMLTGRTPGPGPDLVSANRAWLAALGLAAYAGFVGWQLALPSAPGDAGGAAPPHAERHGRHGDDD